LGKEIYFTNDSGEKAEASKISDNLWMVIGVYHNSQNERE
jgi:hypothetical protein